MAPVEEGAERCLILSGCEEENLIIRIRELNHHWGDSVRIGWLKLEVHWLWKLHFSCESWHQDVSLTMRNHVDSGYGSSLIGGSAAVVTVKAEILHN